MVDASAAASAAKWIGAALVKEGQYLYGVEDNVRALQKDLQFMHQLLQDAETSQEVQLLDFAPDIRELAFRAEDAIDSYIVDVATKIDRKSFFLKLACTTAHPYKIHTLIQEIEAIQQELQKANERFQTFGRIVQRPQENIGSIASSRPTPVENYIHLDDEVIVGIDADISRLANHLVDPTDDFKVLAIVGTGGGGKTTLATKLYLHTQVQSRFSHKAFVSISQKWSRIDVLQRIFKEVKEFKMGDVVPSSETELVRQLHDFLKDKRCLIVLDDMWKTQAWDDIYPVLSRSNKGCRVIITTRIEEVPLYADSKCITHEPKLFTEDQKWELFSKVAMEGRVGIENNEEFEKLGRQMLGKSDGLPLAVVTLAGVLRTKIELYQWEDTSKAYVECILKGKGAPNYGVVKDMMELSYLDLPSYLKPCFLFLAVCDGDGLFQTEMVAEFWVAEGFVTNDIRKEQETLEEAAMRLFEELAQRCILQVTERSIQGQIFKCRVHDLCESFALRRPRNISFLGRFLRHPQVQGDQGNQDEQLF